MNVNQFALSKFGGYIKKRPKYLNMRKKLRSAHIFVPYEEYVSTAVLISILVANIGLLIGIIIGAIIWPTVSPFLPKIVTYDPVLGSIFLFFEPFKQFTVIILAAATFVLLLGGITYKSFMMYPSFMASIRKVQIDTQLPHAIVYMYALSKGETNIIEVIRGVAKLPNIYGELSNEFGMVLRDTDLLGIDFMTALRNIQDVTPSPSLNQFIGNLITLIDNGGDITDFLSMQIENMRVNTRREHSLFLDMLGLVAESYVTGFVAGPLFIIIVGATLGSMKGDMTWMMMALVYGAIPLGTIGIIFVVDMMLPKDEQKIGLLNLKKIKEFAGIRKLEVPEEQEKKLYAEYDFSKKRKRIVKIIRDPLRAFFEEPGLSLYVSVPLAVIVLLIPIISNPAPLFKGYIIASQYLTNYILLSILIALIPYIVFYEARTRRTRNIENSIPEFLRNLLIINETGLSLAESLRIMLRTERGIMREYIERMYTDIVWGASITDAFIRFANRIRLNTLSRIVALVTKASESSGDIREVLDIASKDANINVQLKKDKFTNMIIYLIVIYMAYLVFVYVVYVLGTTFLPEMGKAAKGGGMFIKNFNLQFYSVFFYHTALIQGFFSGMMAGVMGEGDYNSGFKHSVIMMLIAFVIFTFLVKTV